MSHHAVWVNPDVFDLELYDLLSTFPTHQSSISLLERQEKHEQMSDLVLISLFLPDISGNSSDVSVA